MENWSNKKVTIKSENKIEIICNKIFYQRGVSDFTKTAIGQVESLNPGTLILYSEYLGQDLLSINKGMLSFESDGKLHIFEIIGISSRSEKSITFSVAPQE